MTGSEPPTASRQQAGLPARECPACGVTFIPYRSFQRACSRRCRDSLPVANDAPHARDVTYSCVKCGKSVTLRSTVGAGVFRYCLDCRTLAEADNAERKNIARRERWKNDPEYRERSKAISRRSRYGISPERYEEMLQQQSGVCAICASPPNPNGIKSASRLHVDHDHSSGLVRRLLCLNCNRGIGYFGDDPQRLEAAAHYLRTFGR